MSLSLIATIEQFVSHNQLFVGVGAAGVAGAFISKIRSIPDMVSKGMRRLFVVEIRVNSTHDSFEVIQRWLALQPSTKKTRSLSISTRQNIDDDDDVAFDGGGQDWYLAPGHGFHWFRWRRRFVWMYRGKVEKSTGNQETEEIILSMLTRDVKPMWELVAEAYQKHQEKDVAQIRVWRGWWVMAAGRTPRPLDTITLKQGQLEALLEDFAWFAENRSWYVKRGIPYRRGYLFTGKPGTGKSSLVLALGSYLKRAVCIINLATLDDDDALISAVNGAPLNSIILIEDIDCISSARTRVKGEGEDTVKAKDDDGRDNPGVSQAGLLNALDGLLTPEGRLFFMTTNHPERLDAALIRPGRADVHVVFHELCPEDQARMAERFYPAGSFEPVEFDVAPATLQAAFMRNPDDPVAARAQLLGEDILQ